MRQRSPVFSAHWLVMPVESFKEEKVCGDLCVHTAGAVQRF